MKKYIIDTNALISFVTDRNPAQQEKIAHFFEQAAQLKIFIFCHQHILTEFIYVMDKVYGIPKNEIGKMVADLIEMPGIVVVSEIDFPRVLLYWPASFSDFGDAVIASACRNIKASVIITFDRKFIENLKLMNYPAASSGVSKISYRCFSRRKRRGIYPKRLKLNYKIL